MRDALREQDIERRLDIRGGVTVDVDDHGRTLVTFASRDLLDALIQEPTGLHDECGEYDIEEVDDARAEGYRDGRDSAIADLKRLAGAA